MIEKINDIIKSKFIRNIIILVTGTASAQAIAMVFAPIITRLYGPESFGLLGVFLAIVAIVAPIATLTYPIAIILPKSDTDAKILGKLSAYIAIGMTFLFSVLIFLTDELLTNFFILNSISHFLLLIPIAMLFSALQQILQQWLIRKNKFDISAKAAIIHALIFNITTVTIGIFYAFENTLIILATLSNAIYAFIILIMAKNKIFFQKNHIKSTKENKPNINSIINIAIFYRDFPIYRSTQDTINGLSQALPILMIGTLFGPSAAGFYTLSKTVMGVPSNIIGKSFSDVFYPHITKAAYSKENLSTLIIKATFILSIIGFIPFATVIIYGPWLFSFVFGAEWAIAGEYARWLSLLFFFNFINKPSVAAVPVLGIQKGLLFYEIFSTGAKAIGMFAGFYWFESSTFAIALFSMSGVVSYCILIFWIFLCSTKWNENAKTS